MHIRAHHLLCIQGFQGYGYSDAFINHLDSVIKELSSNQIIEITNDIDDICNACPNCEENMCTAYEGGVKATDNIVLKKLSLSPGTLINSYDALLLVKKTFKTRKSLEQICDFCPWKYVCKFYLSLK